MLEAIRVIVLERMNIMKENSRKWNPGVCPNIKKILERLKEQQRFWHVIPASGNLFEVRSESEGFTFDEGKRTYSCRMWQLSGIPCVHATKIYSMAGSDDENPPPPPPQTPTQQAPHTLSTIKLLIMKKGEYDIWAMKMEHYLSHTYYHIWEVIQKGNGPVGVSTDTNGVIKVPPPKTAEEILARERKKSKDHLAYGFTRRPFSKISQDD
ncbi:ribonuclease H-like domain-containing protein [Tanacetum coccineum]